MQADFFSILNLRPGRYEKEAIDRQYRSVTQEILRTGGPNRQQRLDDALIARYMLASADRQAAMLRRHIADVRRRPPRKAVVIATRRTQEVRPLPAPAAGDVHARFAHLVAEQMEDGLLRFTARQRLLTVASGLGIAAFKANLIVAEVLHERQIRNPKLEIRNKLEAPNPNPEDADSCRAAQRERYGVRLAVVLILSAACGLALTLLLVR
jgi:hypothetical protein